MFEGLKEEEKKELESYFQIANALATTKVNMQISNEGKYHAAIIMAAIFKNAKKEINIFAGDFNGEISNLDIYTIALEKCLQDGNKKIDVIFERAPNINSRALSILNKYQNVNNISIKVACKESLDKFTSQTKNSNLIHFTTGDDSMYRCETDTNNYKAICNYGDKSFVQRLKFLFEILSENAHLYAA